MIVFIGCGKKKKNYKCKAMDMYIGNYFTTCLEFARKLVSDRNIFILSAKYGVIHLNDIIIPYEKTLKNMNKHDCEEWNKKIYKQLRNSGINKEEKVIAICGKKYRQALLNYFDHVHVPTFMNNGIGIQMSYMKKIMKGETN